MDTQKYPSVAKVVDHIFTDQGDLATDYSITLPEGFDWDRVERFLATLTEEEVKTFAVGDFTAIAHRSEDAEYANEAVEELFMLIGG